MKKDKEKVNVLGIVLGVVLGLYVISMILPLLWMLLTTLKSISEYEIMEMPNSDRLGNMLWWPKKMTLENYAACTAPKLLLQVPGAAHGLSYPADPERYLDALREIEKQYNL